MAKYLKRIRFIGCRVKETFSIIAIIIIIIIIHEASNSRLAGRR